VDANASSTDASPPTDTAPSTTQGHDMAEICNGFDQWTNQGSSYPMDEWLNGDTWRITEADLQAMGFSDLARYIQRVGKQRGLKVRTKRWDYVLVDTPHGKQRLYQSLYVKALPV